MTGLLWLSLTRWNYHRSGRAFSDWQAVREISRMERVRWPTTTISACPSSIPAQEIVEGFTLAHHAPKYATLLSTEEIDALVEFIKEQQ